MKILFISNRGEIGGAHTALENTLISLSKKHSLTLLTPNKNSKWFEFCQNYNIKCIRIKYYEIGYAFNIPLFRRIIKKILLPIFLILNRFNYFKAKKIKKYINIKDFDYIHTNTNRDDFGIVLSKMYGIKHIMQLREFDKEFFKLHYLRKNVYNYLNNNTYIFISVSEAIKENYIKKGIRGEKIITVYDYVDSSKIIQKSNYNIDNTFKMIMVSNICEEKGQKRLINAIYDSKFRSKIKLDLYGTGSQEYISSLKKYTIKKGLQNQVIFMGYDNEIKTKLQNYDIAVMCSKVDGFGLVTVEYMLAGLPVLIPNTGANNEIVSNNETGFVFDYNSDEALKNKIDFMICNYEKVISVAKNGRKDAKDRFGVANYVNSLERVYERGITEK